MLEQILCHSNIGNQTQILHIIQLLQKEDSSLSDLKLACISVDYLSPQSYEGIIQLLQWLEIISVVDEGTVAIQFAIDESKFVEQICELLFKKLEEEKQLGSILNYRSIILDNGITIKKNFIKLRFSQMRNFLYDIGLFVADDLMESIYLRVAPEYVDWFMGVVVPLAEKSQVKDNSIDEFLKRQQNLNQYGREAEEFALSYEKASHSKHPKVENIQIISEVDAGAGYDIQSYMTNQSVIVDKFIEVKSYLGKKTFYWSKNEIDVAQHKKDNYFLYLIDRAQIPLKDYAPFIIQNPYASVFENDEWVKSCQNWRLEEWAYKKDEVF